MSKSLSASLALAASVFMSGCGPEVREESKAEITSGDTVNVVNVVSVEGSGSGSTSSTSQIGNYCRLSRMWGSGVCSSIFFRQPE